MRFNGDFSLMLRRIFDFIEFRLWFRRMIFVVAFVGFSFSSDGKEPSGRDDGVDIAAGEVGNAPLCCGGGLCCLLLRFRKVGILKCCNGDL